ncbi:MAG: hypothetical protein JW874_00285, partial [Spirochaetales bacterium]|nr:hypothetical protein [Spirochaetales bacterium]
PEQAMQNQMQDVAFEYEIMNLIWKNKTILPDLLNKLPPKMTELKNDMKGLVEQYAERDYDESFLMSNTSIDVIRGTYRAPGKENYDGKLELKVLGVPIFEVLIHTWAEHEGTHPYKDGTISLGKLTGKLEKNSKSFSEYIKLFSDWYIHPNALTKNGKTEPYNGGLPRSKGCLVMDINNWNVFVDALSTLGFEFGNESKNKIDVNISLSENADKSNIQHAFGYQPERYGYWQRKEYWRF